jgi:hypothetical protein
VPFTTEPNFPFTQNLPSKFKIKISLTGTKGDNMPDKFKIIADSRGYVLINTNGEYEHHAHLKAYKTCKMLIRLIERKIVPISEYLRGSCLRLTLDEAYKETILRKQAKEKEKPAYFNAKFK